MQNVVAQTTGIIGITYDFSTTAKSTKGSNFDSYLDNSIKGKDNSQTVKKAKAASDKVETSVNKPLSESKESKNLKINNKKTSEDIDTSSAELVLSVFDQIQSIIMNELNLTPEELDSMMTEMGVTLTDLSKPQVIMEMLLKDKGLTDPMEILLDEELQNTFQKLLASVEDIEQQIPPDMTQEDIKEILTQSEIKSGKQSETVDFDSLAVDNEEQQAPVLNDSDMPIDIQESKLKVETQQVISEDSDNKNQGIATMDKSDLTDTDNNDLANTKDLSDTKSSDSITYEIEGFEAFVDNLSTYYDKPIVEFTDDSIRVYDIRDIAEQMVEKIRVMAKPGQTTMELQLYPEHLGKVNLTVSSREGVMSAQFVVQNDMAKEAVESQMVILKENLAEHGIKVDTIDVTVGGYSFNQNKQSGDDNQATRKKADIGRKITFEEAVAMSEEDVESDNSNYVIGTIGNSINYKA